MEALSSYTPQQWLLFFYFYCFVGWCFESTYVSICERRLVNRGFLRGPFLPIYGCGAIIMLFVSLPVTDSLPLIFLCGGLAATILEYVTGVCMEFLFKVKYWDYSHSKFNFRGYICLSSSLAWGGFSILLTKIIHVPVASVILRLNDPAADILVDVLTAVFAFDFAMSVKAALDIKNVLSQLSKIKEESEKLRQKMDAAIQENAFFAALAAKHEERKQNAAEFYESLQNMLQLLRHHADGQPHNAPGAAAARAAVDEFKEILSVMKERRRAAKANLSRTAHSLLKSNPSLTSKYFLQALSELKAGDDTATADKPSEHAES